MSNRDVNPTQGFHATKAQLDWGREEKYWSENWQSRPYATADRDFEHYRPAYRYGAEAAHRHPGKRWDEVEDDLRLDWERYEHRGERAWEAVKEAVRDGYSRLARTT